MRLIRRLWPGRASMPEFDSSLLLEEGEQLKLKKSASAPSSICSTPNQLGSESPTSSNPSDNFASFKLSQRPSQLIFETTFSFSIPMITCRWKKYAMFALISIAIFGMFSVVLLTSQTDTIHSVIQPSNQQLISFDPRSYEDPVLKELILHTNQSTPILESLNILPTCTVIDGNLSLSLLRYSSVVQHSQVHADCRRYPATGDCEYNDVRFRPRWLVFHVSAGAAGGYGDRMKGLLTALPLAMISGRAFAIMYEDHIPFTAIFNRGELEWIDFDAIPFEVRYGRTRPAGFTRDALERQAKLQHFPFGSLKDVDWYNARHAVLEGDHDWFKEWENYDIVRVRHNLNTFTDILDHPYTHEAYRRFGFHALTEKGDMDLYWQCLMDFAFTYAPAVRNVLNPLMSQLGRPAIESFKQRRQRQQDEQLLIRASHLDPSDVLGEQSLKESVGRNLHKSAASLIGWVYGSAQSLLDTMRDDTNKQATDRLYCAQLRLGSNGHSGNHSIAFHDSEGFLNNTQFRHIFEQLEAHILRDQSTLPAGSTFSLFITSDSDEAIELPASLRHARLLDVPGPTAHMDKIDPETAKNFNATLGAFVKVVATHHLLGECDIAVISASGFGATSRWRTRNRGLLIGEPLTSQVYQGTFRVANENTTFIPYQHMRASGGREDSWDYRPVNASVKPFIDRDYAPLLDERIKHVINASLYNMYQGSSALIEPIIIPVDPLVQPTVVSEANIQKHRVEHEVLQDTSILVESVPQSTYYVDCVNSFLNRSHPLNNGVSLIVGVMSNVDAVSRATQRALFAPWNIQPIKNIDEYCLQAEARALVQQGHIPHLFEQPLLSQRHEHVNRDWSFQGTCKSNSNRPLPVSLSWASVYDRTEVRFVIDRSAATALQRAELDAEQSKYHDILFIGELDDNSTSSCSCSTPFTKEERDSLTRIPLSRTHSQRLPMAFLRQVVATSHRAQRMTEKCGCVDDQSSPMSALDLAQPVNTPFQALVVTHSTTFVHLPNLVDQFRSFRKANMLNELYYGMQITSPANPSKNTVPSHVTFAHDSAGFALSMDLAEFFASNQGDVIIQASELQKSNQQSQAVKWGSWLTARGRLLGRDQAHPYADPEAVYRLNHALVYNFYNAMPDVYAHPLTQSSYSLTQLSPATVMVTNVDLSDDKMVGSLVSTFQCLQPVTFDWTDRQWWLERLTSGVRARGGFQLDELGNPIPESDWWNDWQQSYKLSHHAS